VPHYSKYTCSECGDEFKDKSKLVRKRVDFVVLGGRTLVSRTVSWLCIDKCMKKDADYNRKPFDAPGMRSPSLERVRAARESANGKG
jgi:hypothetical protein